MATLLTDQSSDGAGSGQTHTGPCTVFVPNDSVFDKAVAHIEAYATDTAGKYIPAGRVSQLVAPGAVDINIQGTYFLRGRVSRAGGSTSISMVTTQ